MSRHVGMSREIATPGRARAILELLSRREVEVLHLAADGDDNEEIADRLFISARTVERHLQNVYRKLGVEGKTARTAAVARLLRQESAADPAPVRGPSGSRGGRRQRRCRRMTDRVRTGQAV